jgi:hypothetical protein
MLSDSGSVSLDGFLSLAAQFVGTGAESSMSVRLGPYSLDGGVVYTVMANLRAASVGAPVTVTLEEYAEDGSVIGTISGGGGDVAGTWLIPPGIFNFGTSPPRSTFGYIVIEWTGLPAALVPPSPITVTPTGSTGSTSWAYAVTALNSLGESLPSMPGITGTGVVTLTGSHTNVVSWPAVAGAASYNVYRATEPSYAEFFATFASYADLEGAFANYDDLFTMFFGGFQLLGNTAATSFTDLGSAVENQALPTENTTGVTHFVDEVGLFIGQVAAWSNIPPGTITIRRSDGEYVRGASPLFPISFASAGTSTIVDLDAPYGVESTYVAALTAGGRSTAPSMPSVAVVMGQAPDTCTLYGRIGWATDKDDSGELLAWIAGIGEMMQVIDSVAADQVMPDGSVAPGWSQVLDIDRCPTYALPWLGQFVGARIPTGLRDDQMRWMILNSPGWGRGAVDSIAAAANLFLRSGFTATITERLGGDAYALGISIPTAGIVGDATYQDIYLTHVEYSQLPGAFATYADLWASDGAILDSIDSAIPAALSVSISFD